MHTEPVRKLELRGTPCRIYLSLSNESGLKRVYIQGMMYTNTIFESYELQGRIKVILEFEIQTFIRA